MEVRNQCNVCNYKLSDLETNFHDFYCNVRYFKMEQFKVWRCPQCRTIHCYNVVELDKYYSHYFYDNGSTSFPFPIFNKRILKQLKRIGLNEHSSLLDYGCANGAFIDYFKEQGYEKCYGYDPYSSVDSIKDDSVLKKAPFDFILLQDVIEHVEDPYTFLSQLSPLLKTGGIILIGTPNADNIDLNDNVEFKNEVHVPYHLHIYTKKSLQDICNKLGYKMIHSFGRSYLDSPLLGLNERAQLVYQELAGGSIDDVMQNINYMKLITSPKFIVYSVFGYVLSHKANMSIAVKKE